MNRSISILALGVVVGACNGDGDGGPEPFEPGPTIATAPVDPLAGGTKTGCPIYLEERCQAGGLQRCEIFDTTTEAFVDDPDPLLRRVFLYDRWYDLYSSPLGLTAERVFTGPMPGDAPEAEWSSPESFSHWAGASPTA